MTCSSSNKKFAVSVGKAYAYGNTCAGEKLMFIADTLMNSTISQAIQSAQVYGGPGSRLLFEFDYQKEITVALEDAAFSPEYLAIQNGTALVNQLGDVYRNETVTFDAFGSATLKYTPSGSVQVGQEDGTYMLVLPTTNTISVPTMAGKEAVVVYTESMNAKTITIDSSSFPQSMKLVITIDIFDSNNVKVEEMQFIVPKFKPDGNFELALTHDGVATSSLNGKAMDSCGKYAEVKIIPIAGAGTNCTTTALIAIPNPIQLDDTTSGDSETLVVRPQFSDGSLGAPLDNSTLTFATSLADVATVDGTGKVTVGAHTGQVDTAEITITVTNDASVPALKVPVVIL